MTIRAALDKGKEILDLQDQIDANQNEKTQLQARIAILNAAIDALQTAKATKVAEWKALVAPL
jgi:uncharacterized protein YlxW (UPF0749 family)